MDTTHDFESKGYAVFPGLLKEDLDSILLLAGEMSRPRRERRDGDWNSMGQVFNTEGKLHKVQGCCAADPRVLEEVFKNPKVVKRVRSLMHLDECAGIDVFGTKFFPMWPSGGESVSWHTDSHFFGTSAPDIVSCAVYLEDTNVANGCFRLIPASHLVSSGSGDTHVDKYPHVEGANGVPQGEWIEESALDCDFGTESKLDVCCEAGTVVLFDARLIHSAHKNTSSDKTRFSLFGHFVPSTLSFQWKGIDFSRGAYADRHPVC